MKKERKFERFLENLFFMLYFSLGVLLAVCSADIAHVHDIYDNADTYEFESVENLNYSLTYVELEFEEIEHVESIFEDIKPIYLAKQNYILIVKNISKYCDDCIGFNMNNGEMIVVQYTDNDKALRVLICHELFHTFIGGIDMDHEESIVEDLERYSVCFTGGKKVIW